MGSSRHAPATSRRCVESDPKVCRERPKGKEKSASVPRLRRSAGVRKAPGEPDAQVEAQSVRLTGVCRLETQRASQ